MQNNCATCGLEQPGGIPHTSLDHCQIALVAAQDAVKGVIAAHIKRIGELQLLQNAKMKGGEKHED
jgi:small basic protein